MTTTLDILYLKDNFAYWGHLGDSRIYYLKGNTLRLLTKDHTLIQKLIEEGFLTLKQANNHPSSNIILKALGKENPEPDLSKMRLSNLENHRFFLCSDGVSSLINETELQQILSEKDFDSIQNTIISLVRSRGAADDYSFILIEKVIMVGKRILNYQIISLLGEGGMGSVYKAYDLQLERYVAIKIIKPKLLKDPIFVERFRIEAKNQAKLNHPNIVTVYGFIETREATGFVMEYVDGSTISQLITTYGRLDLIYSMRVLQQVLLAIDYAHSMGFVHRDLKPSNIIIDRNGIAKIMDFGISKSLNENQRITRVGFNIGTIHYMSPEQIKGLEPSPQTDIYSLGITLYEMLSGSPPFTSKSDYEIYEAHLKMIPRKLSETFPEIPNEVDDLILSALNKSNKKNFLNAYEFRSSIEQLIFNLPLLVSRPSANQSQTNSVSRQKNRSANLIVAFIALLIVLIIGLSYILVEKFIIKEKINSSSENKSEVII